MPPVIRRTLGTTGIAALLALTAILLLGPAASAHVPTAAGKTKTLTLSWTLTSLHQHQANPTATSSGDTLQAQYAVTGTIPGSADFSCVAVGTHYLCQGIIRLRAGDIYAEVGPVDETQPAAIVGGTRAYMGMTGQFTQKQNTDTTGVWTVQLRS
jgi:hypothetical protein